MTMQKTQMDTRIDVLHELTRKARRECHDIAAGLPSTSDMPTTAGSGLLWALLRVPQARADATLWLSSQTIDDYELTADGERALAADA